MAGAGSLMALGRLAAKNNKHARNENDEPSHVHLPAVGSRECNPLDLSDTCSASLAMGLRTAGSRCRRIAVAAVWEQQRPCQNGRLVVSGLWTGPARTLAAVSTRGLRRVGAAG